MSKDRGILAVLFRVVRTLIGILGQASAFLVLGIMFLITADVLSRYILGIPVKGAYEISEMMFLTVVFLGLAYTQLYNGHVRVEFLVLRLSHKIQLWMNTIMLIISFVIYLLLVWQGAEGFWNSFESGEYRWGLIQIPLWPVKLMVPVGAGFLCLRFIEEIVDNIKRILNAGE